MGRSSTSQTIVDFKIQAPLVARVAAYWAVAAVSSVLLMYIWNTVTGPSRLFQVQLIDVWAQCGPVLVATLVLLPFVAIDILRFSNRFTGPAVRLKSELHRLASGENVDVLKYRSGDFWYSAAEDFNRIRDRLHHLEFALRKAEEHSHELECKLEHCKTPLGM